jgi:hypothetical protein
MRLPATTERVTRHTSEDNNRRIRHEMENRLSYYADHPGEIAERLRGLDREWDVERTLEANASSLALSGLVLALTVNGRFVLIPAMVTAFLLQHALQGWCPPVPVLRRFGFRTQSEIELERYALKALRGDFGPLSFEGPDVGRQAKVEKVLEVFSEAA